MIGLAIRFKGVYVVLLRSPSYEFSLPLSPTRVICVRGWSFFWLISVSAAPTYPSVVLLGCLSPCTLSYRESSLVLSSPLSIRLVICISRVYAHTTAWSHYATTTPCTLVAHTRVLVHTQRTRSHLCPRTHARFGCLHAQPGDRRVGHGRYPLPNGLRNPPFLVHVRQPQRAGAHDHSPRAVFPTHVESFYRGVVQ